MTDVRIPTSGITMHFDLAVEVNADGTATARLSEPGSFSPPIAEVEACHAGCAVSAMIAKVDFDCRAEQATPPLPTIYCNGHHITPGVIPGGSSPNGNYVGHAVIQMALSLGWHDEMARGAAETYEEWYHRPDWAHSDHWHDLVTEAEEWLNESTDNGLWHWADGDFRVDVTEECPECEEFRFADPEVRGEVDPCGEHLSWG
jgi:hypothetical protein